MKHLTRASAVAAACAAALVAVGLATPVAADVTGQYFADGDNASDPFIYRCAVPGNDNGYCMVTSQDLAEAPLDKGGPGENYYPMIVTRIMYSDDGLNWTTKQMATHEFFVSPGTIASGTKHLWAPALTRWNRTGSSTADYYLYVPDITDPADRLASRIFVMSSGTNPLSWYSPYTAGASTNMVTGGADDTEYMSDPEVFTNSTSPGNRNQKYLLWATGDASTCGGIAIRKMTGPTTLQPYGHNSDVEITINGITPALGGCDPEGPVTSVGRPYYEGASLFRFDTFGYSPRGGMPGPYTLVFAAKPTKVPDECKAPGQPNQSTNEVIAYATSSSITGPYQYQGLIMCGSTTEWTDQATIEVVKGGNGEDRLVLVYHDAPNTAETNGQQRKLHSECLYTYGGKFVLSMRSTDGAANVNGVPQWCINSSTVTAIKSMGTGRYVKSNNGLFATSENIGTWEQFSLEANTGSITYISARNPGAYVTSTTSNTVVATSGFPGTHEKFTLTRVGGDALSDTYWIKDWQGRYLHTDASGKVVPGTTSNPGFNVSYMFTFEYLTN